MIENKEYSTWIEIQANKKLILNAELFQKTMERCKDAGMTGIILSVKDTTGFVIYKSHLAEHYSCYDPEFEKETDYVSQCFSIIRNLGMKCFAAFDVFAEGNRTHPMLRMKGLYRYGWQCQVYGLNEQGEAKIVNSTDAQDLLTVGNIDDFGEVFVNPGNPEVRDYEISLIREFATVYHPDGILLDRVRYIGLSADFSHSTKEGMEQYIGAPIGEWPQDIYQIEKTKDGAREVPGKYFGDFICYRAQIIKDFIERVSTMLKEEFEGICFGDYTGSWYPLYYQVGANWASKNYIPVEFPWCNMDKMKQTGYAEMVDSLYSGCYYENVTIEEAKEQPAYWYSVEGAGFLARQVTCQKENLIDSLFLEQYKERTEKISQAINRCFENSAGCMLFDLSYIVSNNWWKQVRKVTAEPYDLSEKDEVIKLCEESFTKEYRITGERMEQTLFEDPEFSKEASFTLRAAGETSVLGFIGVKLSQNQSLYPDTAWISIMAVDKNMRGLGYGHLLLQKTMNYLKDQGFKKIFLGQDFSNFFSGIPDPEESKVNFFLNMGFTINDVDHYDLEADIINNEKIQSFNTKDFEKDFVIDTYHGQKESLLAFLAREFPGRWEFEADMAIKEGKNPQEIVLLWNREKSKVLGFCMLTVVCDEMGKPTGYGGLGPVGIAKEIRGRHVGDYILHQSLGQLEKLKVTRVNIDWTILKDFYGQFGFVPERTYQAAFIELQNIEKED